MHCLVALTRVHASPIEESHSPGKSEQLNRNDFLLP